MGDWFEENKPQAAAQSGGDWFAANAPNKAQPEQPSAMSRFMSSAGEELKSLNPVPAVKEWLNRPNERRKLGAGFEAAHAVKTGKRQNDPETERIINEGLHANVGGPTPSMIPSGSEPLIKAGSQAQQGNIAGAVGTLGGAGGVAVASMAAPAILEGAAKVGGKFARRLYGSALKPSPSLPLDERAAILDTALDKGITVGEGGVRKLRGKIDANNQAIQTGIQAQSDQLGPVVSPENVARRIEDVRPKFENQATPRADRATLDAVKKEFLEENSTQAPYTKVFPMVEEGTGYGSAGRDMMRHEKPMTLAETQAKKTGTYRQIRDAAYGELGSAGIEARKQLGRGMKENIEQRAPWTKDVNADTGQMIDLEPHLNTATGRHANKDVLGISAPIAVTAVDALAGHAPAVAMGAAKLAGNPWVKSVGAIGLDRAAKQLPRAAGPVQAGVMAAPVVNRGQISSGIPEPSPAQKAAGQLLNLAPGTEPKLDRAAISLKLPDALQVFQQANPDERQAMRATLAKRARIMAQSKAPEWTPEVANTANNLLGLRLPIPQRIEPGYPAAIR